MGNIEIWFPVAIYKADNLFNAEQNNLWKNHLLEIKQNNKSGGEDWYGDTYTTHNVLELKNDKVLEPLIQEIRKHVNHFAQAHRSDAEYNPGHCWANIGKAGNYQEFHTHDGSVFSAVYYITAPEGSGRIIFVDPKQPDMLPLKNIKDRNELSYIKCSYAPQEGQLLIFRSYLSHMVEPGTNTKERISISINFD